MNRLSAALLATLLCSGCAFPQYPIDIQPDVWPSVRTIGQGREIGVSVFDERTTKVIANFGTELIPTSDMVSKYDLAETFATVIVDNLNTLGFRASLFDEASPPSDGAVLRVYIRKLEFIPEGGVWKIVDRVRGSMTATATRGGQVYENDYAAEEENIGYWPAVNVDHEELVSAAVSRLLKDFFSDQALFDFLSRDERSFGVEPKL